MIVYFHSKIVWTDCTNSVYTYGPGYGTSVRMVYFTFDQRFCGKMRFYVRLELIELFKVRLQMIRPKGRMLLLESISLNIPRLLCAMLFSLVF